MDIKKELLKGHSKTISNKIISYVGANQSRFNTLITIFLAGPSRITQRAAWPISHCVRNHPFLIEGHHAAVIKIIDKSDIHDGAKRNILRFLQFVEIPKKHHGTLIGLCFKLMDPKEAVAIRVFAMTVLANLAKQHPDIKRELKLVIEDHLPFGSAAYLSRSKKILKQLEK